MLIELNHAFNQSKAVLDVKLNPAFLELIPEASDNWNKVYSMKHHPYINEWLEGNCFDYGGNLQLHIERGEMISLFYRDTSGDNFPIYDDIPAPDQFATMEELDAYWEHSMEHEPVRWINTEYPDNPNEPMELLDCPQVPPNEVIALHTMAFPEAQTWELVSAIWDCYNAHDPAFYPVGAQGCKCPCNALKHFLHQDKSRRLAKARVALKLT